MEHFTLAIAGDAFARNSEDLIRKRFPRELSFSVKVPVPGHGTTEIDVALKTIPRLIGADIQNNGQIHIHAEIEVYLASITHHLIINDVFPAGQPIPGTSVPMKTVPLMPLTHTFADPPLIAVPRIEAYIRGTTQSVLEGQRIQLNAQIDPGDILVLPNFAGFLQVLSDKLTKAITDGINGAFGHSFLAEILAAVANFLNILLQHLLKILKLPETLLAALEHTFVDLLHDKLRHIWSPRHVPLFAISRLLNIAPEVVRPGHPTKAAVNVLIATIGARANVDGDVEEFAAELSLSEV